MNNDFLNLAPIGYLYCDEKYNYDTPRQSVLADNTGVIRLNPNCNYEQAVCDLEGFERIWLIYAFHRNTGWKPKVTPPRTPENKKISLFATRSPHRPNPIGLSCVVLEKIEGLQVFIRNFDLLNETPILDIKPYIPYCDSFPDSKAGWLDSLSSSVYEIITDKLAQQQMDWIYANTGLDLLKFAKIQLAVEPLNYKRKRISKVSDNNYVFAYRTWRIFFNILEEGRIIKLLNVSSGYTESDLSAIDNDKYFDKKQHIDFIEIFGC